MRIWEWELFFFCGGYYYIYIIRNEFLTVGLIHCSGSKLEWRTWWKHDSKIAVKNIAKEYFIRTKKMYGAFLLRTCIISYDVLVLGWTVAHLVLLFMPLFKDIMFWFFLKKLTSKFAWYIVLLYVYPMPYSWFCHKRKILRIQAKTNM